MKKALLICFSLMLAGLLSACDTKNESEPKTQEQSSQTQNKPSDAQEQQDSEFDMKSIISSLQKAGAVNGEGESADFSSAGGVAAVRFDTMAIVKYSLDTQDYFTAYDKGETTVDGTTWTVYGAYGPYLLLSSNKTPDNKLVKAFEDFTGIPYK